jgi:hypothetical protein
MTALPKPAEFVREAVILIGGAVLAAWLLSNLPEVRAYINRNLSRPGGDGGCNCQR